MDNSKKNSMKLYYLKRIFLQSPKNVKYYLCKLHAYKKNFQRFRNKKLRNLEGHHDLYVQRSTLLLANIFQNFKNMS